MFVTLPGISTAVNPPHPWNVSSPIPVTGTPPSTAGMEIGPFVGPPVTMAVPFVTTYRHVIPSTVSSRGPSIAVSPTTSVSSFSTFTPAASVSAAVNENSPVSCGVPRSTPALVSSIPEGKALGIANTMSGAFAMSPLSFLDEYSTVLPSPALMPMVPPAAFPGP